VLSPIVKRQSETLALSRIVESTVIVVGLISLLSVVTLREDFAGAGADAGSPTIAGQSLVAVYDWTFLLWPGFCVGVNRLLLGYLFYRSGLVPRQIAMLGLIGGRLIFASAIAVLFGAYEQDGAHFLFSIPEIAFEAGIIIYTIWKGFRSSSILDDSRYIAVIAPDPNAMSHRSDHLPAVISAYDGVTKQGSPRAFATSSPVSGLVAGHLGRRELVRETSAARRALGALDRKRLRRVPQVRRQG
jgi:hypothetical protein